MVCSRNTSDWQSGANFAPLPLHWAWPLVNHLCECKFSILELAPSRNLSINADCALIGSSSTLNSIVQHASSLLRRLGHQMGRPRDARMSPTAAALFVFVLVCNLMVAVSSGNRPLPAFISHCDQILDLQRN
jgi:hypothetical protein